MAIYKPKINYDRHTDLEVLAEADSVISNLSNNANFPLPTPTVAMLTLARNEFSDAVTAATHGGTILTAIRKEKRAILENLLRAEAIYVLLNGKNILSVLESSGFVIYSSIHGARPQSESSTIKKVMDGLHSGDVIVRTNKVKYAQIYELRYTEEEFSPSAKFTYLRVQTATTFTITGLTPSNYIWIQVRTMNTKGVSDWSPPVRFMVR